jgi:hypothetical protein
VTAGDKQSSCSSETSVDFKRIIRRYITEINTPQGVSCLLVSRRATWKQHKYTPDFLRNFCHSPTRTFCNNIASYSVTGFYEFQLKMCSVKREKTCDYVEVISYRCWRTQRVVWCLPNTTVALPRFQPGALRIWALNHPFLVSQTQSREVQRSWIYRPRASKEFKHFHQRWIQKKKVVFGIPSLCTYVCLCVFGSLNNSTGHIHNRNLSLPNVGRCLVNMNTVATKTGAFKNNLKILSRVWGSVTNN